jgi:acyl carrier protein
MTPTGDNVETMESLVFSVLEIDPDTTGDVSQATHGEWTSIKQIQIIVTLEDAYDVVFSGEEMAEGTSVSRLRAMLASKGVPI